MNSWPHDSGGSGTSDQVPTELQYIDPSTRKYVCGYEIPRARRNSVKPLRWFKLLLQNTGVKLECSENPTPAAKTLEQLNVLKIRPEEVVEDFLRSIKKITLDSLMKTYDRQFVNDSKVEFVITIPAIWSDSAKELMASAAQKAGYGCHRVDFHLISEPEAIAAYTIRVIQPHEFKKDDTFIICDARDRNVDLTTYRIDALNPLRIYEVVSESRDLCASVDLDNGFKKYIEGKIGASVLENMSQRSRRAMEKSWEEQVKYRFGAPAQNLRTVFEVLVPDVPDDDEMDIEEGFHTMSW